MRVLGVDPGTMRTGYGIIDAVGSRMELVSYGCITNASRTPLSQRYWKIFDGLRKVIRETRPDTMATESLIFCNNVKSAIKLGEARGVVLLAAAEVGCEVQEYSPNKVKQAVVGFGKAHKSQVQGMVKNLLHMNELPEPEDAADALAIAICHVNATKVPQS